MKITYINTLYRPEKIIGGAERSVELLAQWLKNKHQVSVISLHPSRGIFEKNLDGVQVTYIGLQNLYWPFEQRNKDPLPKLLWHILDTWNVAMARMIKSILEKQGPDIVHTHVLTGFSSSVWQSAKQLHVPIVHTLHDYSLLCPKSTMFKNGKNCQHCLDCTVLAVPRIRSTNSVDAVTGVSQYILNRHLELGAFKKTPIRTVISNMSEHFHEKAHYNLIPGQLRLGFMGRLHPTKGVEVLLECVMKLANPSITLYIAGSGSSEYESYLKTRFVGSNIHFLGFVRPEFLFEKIDVLVVPSLWHEPLARVCVDALEYGIPVIGSRRGGIVNLIVDGENGFLFEPGQPTELSRIIKYIKSHPKLLTKMHLKTLESQFSNKSYEDYLKLYKDLLN